MWNARINRLRNLMGLPPGRWHLMVDAIYREALPFWRNVVMSLTQCGNLAETRKVAATARVSHT